MSQKEKGFTLIEILAVVAVLAVLFTLFIPVVSGVRERGRRTQCLNNLKQWGVAFNLYTADNNGEMPPEGSVTSSNGNGWQNALSPYIGTRILDSNAVRNEISAQGKNQVQVCPTRFHERPITSGNLIAIFSYMYNQYLDGNGAGTAAGAPTAANPYPGTPADDDGSLNEFLPHADVNSVVLIFCTPNFQMLGVESAVMINNSGDWNVSHRAMNRMTGKSNLRGSGSNLLFVGGNVRFVGIEDIIINPDATTPNATGNLRRNYPEKGLIWNPWPYVPHRNPTL